MTEGGHLGDRRQAGPIAVEGAAGRGAGGAELSAVAFALGILTGVIVGMIVGVVVQVSTTLWLAAHRGRCAVRVLGAELAAHEIALSRWLDLEHTRNLDESDRRYRMTFAQVAKASGRAVPTLPATAWSDLRGPIIESTPDDLVKELVGWYEPLADRELVENSQLGTAVAGGYLKAAMTTERLESRSRWQGFWFLLRGPG